MGKKLPQVKLKGSVYRLRPQKFQTMLNLINQKSKEGFPFSSNEYYLKNFSKAWQNWEILRMEEVKETSKRGPQKRI